jgi:hypothetical protein
LLQTQSESNVSCGSSFYWAGGDKTGLIAALTEGSYLVFRMRPTVMGMQGPCASELG